MMRYYFAPGTCALAPLIVLKLVGASYEPVRLNLRTEDQRKPDYLAVNPKGRVPALATERGVLTEVPAILAFLAQSYPAAGLAPFDDPFAFAEAQAFNAYLCSTVHVAHAHRMRGYRWASEESSFADMKRKVPQSVGDAFQLIEDDLLKGPWVMGETFTICDPYLFTLAQWLEVDGVPLERLPRVVDHRRRMGELPAVRAAIAEETGT